MDFGHCVGPCKRRALTLAERRRFLPGIEQMHAIFAFAKLARVARVRREAKCASVNLRSANLDKFDQ